MLTVADKLFTGLRFLQVTEELGFTQEIQKDLIDHPEILRDFLGFYRVTRGGKPQGDPDLSMLLKPIDNWLGDDFSVRTCNSLRNHGVIRLFQLVRMSKEDLLMVKNLGRRSLAQVADFLVHNGLNLSMKFEMRDELPVRVIDQGIPLVLP